MNSWRSLRNLSPGAIFKIFIAFSILALILAASAPPEDFLGHRYKLLYIHLPLLFISITSFYLASALAVLRVFGREKGDIKVLLISGLIFAVLNLAVVYIFELLTWGAFIASEPRFYFMSFVYLSALVLLALEYIGEEKLSALFSLIAVGTSLYLYIMVKTSESFQLHPLRFVDMPPEMLLPLIFSFLASLPAFLLVLIKVSKRFNG